MTASSRKTPRATVIDTAEGIVAAFDVTGEATGECGLVTSQTIPAVRAA
jgi:hypothetical protein